MNTRFSPTLVAICVTAGAFLLHPESLRNGLHDFMFLSIAAPYGIYLIISFATENIGITIGGGTALLSADLIGTLVLRTIKPDLNIGGSLVYLFFSWIGQIIIFLPLGIILGWHIHRALKISDKQSDPVVPMDPFKIVGPEIAVKIGLMLGIAFHIWLSLEGDWSPDSLILTIPATLLITSLGVSPYVICYLLNKKIPNKWALLFATLAILYKDIIDSVAMVYFPTNSTASIGMIFLPIDLIFRVMPLGLAAGWIFSKILLLFAKIPLATNTRQKFTKIGYGVLGIAILAAALNVKFIMRDLRKKVDLNAEIGAPRVLIGENTFKKTPAYQNIGWTQVDVFNKESGLEIADISSKQINFLDPVSYVLRRSIPINYSASWADKLISINNDGQLNILHSGGGYSKVGLADLNGTRLWEFQPDAKLPPNKLIAADLDGNGTKEFYATDHTGVYRLDENGRIIWRSSGSGGGYYIGTIPAQLQYPALIISDTPGGKVSMWDINGRLVKEIKPAVSPYMLQVVKWGNNYCLAAGQTSREGSGVFLMDMDGKILFKQHIGDHFGVNEIMSIRFKADKEEFLVVIGGGGSGVHVTELNIFSHYGKLVYKELRESYRLQPIANQQTGTEALIGGNPLVKYEII